MRPNSRLNGFRIAGYCLTGSGVFAVIAGGAGLIVAAALPWATVTVLYTPIFLPGIVCMLGAITAGLGVLVLSQFGFLYRFAWLGIALGLLAVGIGVRAGDETGKGVVRFLLEIQSRIAPFNARLADAGLPPFEPVGSAIGSRRDHVGVGPGYVVWAGGAVAAGSILLLVGERLRHTCGTCRSAWARKHGMNIPFCPNCGVRLNDQVVCIHCAASLERGERFCASCGTGTSSPTSAV